MRRLAGDRRGERIEQHQQSAAAGIDHPRPGQHVQLLGCALQGRLGGIGACGQRRTQAGALTGPVLNRLGRGPQDRDHGALNRLPAHRVHHQGQCVPQRRAQQCRIDIGQSGVGSVGVGGGRRRRVGQPAQDLGQDHPGIAARAVQCSAGQRLRHRSDVAEILNRIPRGLRRTHREQQVCPGVGVGHREHVEVVDLLGMGEQVPHRSISPVQQGGRVQTPVRHRPPPIRCAAVRQPNEIGRRVDSARWPRGETKPSALPRPGGHFGVRSTATVSLTKATRVRSLATPTI